jgi:lipopolysaccharide transport system ATP-binding protein
MKPILDVQGVSKKFRIDHERKSYLTVRDKLSTLFQQRSASHEDFWALRDVSFTVEAGESIGIIGKNGAGKSTLLKILSKITPPTEGRIIGRGRIASLLEVGTGFHPELTGRENVYLNGSILGLKKREIDSRFDEIIDFAGTEKFLDTPLKHYSSGMQLRLAFAVAAFLEPEILVIDEVLAVGDAEFQKKCLGKMEDVSTSGRTVLFVSHNMAAIESLCRRSILLGDGRIQYIGNSEETVQHYLNGIDGMTQNHSGKLNVNPDHSANPVRSIEIMCDGRNSQTAYMGCQFEIRVNFKSKEFLESPVLGVILKDSQNIPMIGVNNKHYTSRLANEPVKEGTISMTIPYLTLFEGIYYIDIHFGNAFNDIEVLKDCLSFIVEPMKFTLSGELPDKKLNHMFIKDIKWSLNKIE